MKVGIVMRFWWVNQNQTYRQETSGGYLWSPKKNSNGCRNPFYESMREVSPGDLIFSFKNTLIPSVGIATSHGYECPKPKEFGTIGSNWEKVGWKVDVSYRQLSNVIRPSDHMGRIRPVLPTIYSPLQQTGRGNQGVYLTELSDELSDVVIDLIGHEVKILVDGSLIDEEDISYKTDSTDFIEWEKHLREEVEADTTIPETERKSLVNSRIGQGKFKDNVKKIEKHCRVTKVDRLEHLRASHLKPWRDSNNTERLDGENGLLLTPSIDHLFDRGFISFENNGDLLISPVSHKESLIRMGVQIDTKQNVGGFTEGQKTFLDYHRESVFLEKRLR